MPRLRFARPRLGMAAGAIIAIVLALLGSACGDDSSGVTTPTTTTESPVTETFSSGVVPAGTSARSFVAAQAGSVEITLVSEFTLVSNTPTPASVALGVGIGIPIVTTDGFQGCNLNMAVTTTPGAMPQITISVDAGSFCVKVFDPAPPLAAETFFTVTIVRP